MKIVDLSKENQELYFKCLEDWSEDMKDSGGHKCRWYERMKDKGLGVKLALDDHGTVGGMIQYAPASQAFVEGEGAHFIYCIWVHGHKEGRGSFQKKGMGKALLAAAEEDARAKGASGMAAWGLWLPFWMKASWFKKQGYRKADRMSIQLLMWKPFKEGARPPRWIRAKKKPELTEGKVTVTAFLNGWCCVQNINHERAKKACAEFGDKVVFRVIDTLDRKTFEEWGISDALFVNDKDIATGPPLSYDKIHKKIARAVKKLH